jgi:PAS domain S-box-containing protein
VRRAGYALRVRRFSLIGRFRALRYGAVVGHAASTPSSSARIAARFTAGARFASAAVIAIAALVVIGWWFDVPVLVRLRPHFATMKLNTALSLIALGAATRISITGPGAGPGSRAWLLRGLAIAAIAIGALSLIETVAAIDLGIDQLVVRDATGNGVAGRMSPWTSICILALGAAVLRRSSPWAGRFALAVALFSHVAVLGYVYGVHDLYAIGPYASVALHTALATYALAVAILLTPPRPRGLLRLLTSDSPGGVLVRRLVPALLVIPAVLALLRQWGEQAGLFGPGFGRALLVASNTVVLLALIWSTAAALIRTDDQRRVAEAGVRDREVYLATTLASIGDGVIATDEHGRIVEMNPVAEQLTGWPGREAAGRPLAEVFDIIDEDSGAAVESPVDRVLRGGVLVGLANHTVLIARDGSRRAIADSGAPIRDGGGPIRGVVLVFRDQTAERAAARALRESRDRLRALAEVSDAFAAVATTYQPLLDQIARTVADVVGDGCVVALISDDGDQLQVVSSAHREPALDHEFKTHLTSVSGALATGTSVAATVARTGQSRRADVEPAAAAAQADEGFRPLFSRLEVFGLAVVPIRARDSVIGTLSVLRNAPGRSYTDDDVTLLQHLADRAGLAIENARLYTQLEQRVYQRTAELEAANQELESFSYSVAHDLRAPLRAIAGFSHALLEDAGDRMTGEDRRLANHIRDAAHRMGELIDALLDLARISRTEPRRRKVDVSELAHRLVAGFRAGQPARSVEVAITDGLVAHADPRLLEIVLTNLLGNAWKFTAKKPEARIEVGVLPGDRPPVFFVRDNGAGFDPAHARNLFGVFQRLHLASDFEGTGIGLATVHRIVRRHGGLIWAEGDPGHGATFYFTLQAPPVTGRAASRRSPS